MNYLTNINVEKKYVPEQKTNDPIYRDSIRNKHSSFISIKDDKDYSIHDYSMSLFSTMGSDIYATYRNNIISNIREKISLDRYAREQLINNIKRYKNPGGIYIIEKYTLPLINNDNMLRLVEYFTRSKKIELPEDELKSIVEYLDSIDRKSFRTVDVTIRLVSFIEESIIRSNQCVYSIDNDICLSIGIPDEMMHPSSKTSMSKKLLHNKSIYTNVFNIEIVDNENKYKPYYIKIGNNIEKVFSKPDIHNEDSVTISQVKNNILLKSNIIEKENYIDNGIFNTYDGAKYLGANKYELDMLKMKHDINKLENEKESALLAADILDRKYKYEFDILNIKLKSTISDYDKKLLERSILHEKHHLDLKILTDKHIIDMNLLNTKLTSDIIVKMFNLAIDKDKYEFMVRTSNTDTIYKYGTMLTNAAKLLIK